MAVDAAVHGMSLREQLIELRAKAGISQEELSRRSGVSISTLRKVEQGGVPDPRWSTITRLAKALDASLDDFMSEDQLPKEESLRTLPPRRRGKK